MVIVIESDFHLYLNVLFSDINQKFINTTLTYNLRFGWCRKYRLVFFSVLAEGAAQLNPFQRALQFLMGWVFIATFTKRYGANILL